ncbi:MAG: hypothetical protein IT440_06575 [Phycisphaeraceae bacterium]|nr:hypothetical protein [Phycisphaeraceae bacterium]
MDLTTGLARCRHCQGIFSVADQLGLACAATTLAPPKAAQEAIVTPSKFQVNNCGADMIIRWKWLEGNHVAMAAVCVIWVGFLIILFYLQASDPHGVPRHVWLFILLQVLMGIGLMYTALAGLLNQTRIHVNGQHISVNLGPVPWVGNQVIPAEQIMQLYCERDTAWPYQHNQSVRYRVSVMATGSRRLCIVRGLRELCEARFLELTIESHLGIEPQAVIGEV